MKIILDYFNRYGYALGYLLNACSNFFLTIILTNYLSKGDFGNYSLFRSAIFTLWPFIGLSTHYYLQVEYLKLKDEKSEFVFTCLLLNLAFFIFVELIFIVSIEPLKYAFDFSTHWILFIPIIALMMSLTRFGLVLMQVKEDIRSFLFIILTQVIVNLLCTIYLIIYNSYDWIGRAISLIISNIIGIAVIILIFQLQGLIKYKFNWNLFKAAFAFGFSAIMLDICIVFIGFTDKFFIKEFINVDSLGIYAVGLQLATVIGVIDSAMTQTIYPKIYNLYNQNKFHLAKSYMFKYIFALGILMLVYSLVAPHVFKHLIGDDFSKSFDVMKLVLVALFSLSIYKMLVTRLYYHKIMSKILIPSILILAVNLVSHFYFIQKIGINGAIITNIFSYSLLAISVFIIGKVYSNKTTF